MFKVLVLRLAATGLSAGAFCVGLAQESWSNAAQTATVEVLKLQDAGFPDAAAPDALALTCGPNQAALAEFYKERKLLFQEDLVFAREGRGVCHIYYEPTLRNFRAARDDQPISGLYVAVDPLAFFAGAEFTGSSLDIAKTVLARLPRSVEVMVSVAGGFDQSMWDGAALAHFGGLPHRLRLFDSGLVHGHPWTQDYLKSGAVGGREVILIPRHLYEGRESDAARFETLLAHLERGNVVRSKLAWEGGDLQFAAVPNDPKRTIIAHGGTAWRYWGRHLTPAEYSYTLKLEFGADEVLDLASLGLHADYLVAFLPAENTVLVSRVVSGDADLARAAAFELLQSFRVAAPPAVRRLAALTADWDGDLATARQAFSAPIAAARQALAGSSDLEETDAETDSRLQRYMAVHCPSDPAICFDTAGTTRMLQTDRELARESSSQAARRAVNARLRPLLLDLIEAQIWPPEWKMDLLDQAAARLESWGFRVIRVPYLVGRDADNEWPGVSYVNLLNFDKRLYVPTLGLGVVEERYLARLKSDLKGNYDVIPVNARASLIKNGGVHCVFGIVRGGALSK